MTTIGIFSLRIRCLPINFQNILLFEKLGETIILELQTLMDILRILYTSYPTRRIRKNFSWL